MKMRVSIAHYSPSLNINLNQRSTNNHGSWYTCYMHLHLKNETLLDRIFIVTSWFNPNVCQNQISFLDGLNGPSVHLHDYQLIRHLSHKKKILFWLTWIWMHHNIFGWMLMNIPIGKANVTSRWNHLYTIQYCCNFS